MRLEHEKEFGKDVDDENDIDEMCDKNMFTYDVNHE